MKRPSPSRREDRLFLVLAAAWIADLFETFRMRTLVVVDIGIGLGDHYDR
jgi:hypothetical protein